MNEYPGFFQSMATAWRDIALAVGISMISGMVAHLHRMKREHPAVWRISTFIADVGTSGMVGFWALMYCIDAQVSPWLTGPIVGIASHAAPRLVFLIDDGMVNLVKLKLGLKDDVSKP